MNDIDFILVEGVKEILIVKKSDRSLLGILKDPNAMFGSQRASFLESTDQHDRRKVRIYIEESWRGSNLDRLITEQQQRERVWKNYDS